MRDVNPLDLVETIREGILVLDPDLTIRFANRSLMTYPQSRWNIPSDGSSWRSAAGR